MNTQAIEEIQDHLLRIRPCSQDELDAAKESERLTRVLNLQDDMDAPDDSLGFVRQNSVAGAFMAPPGAGRIENVQAWLTKFTELKKLMERPGGVVLGICGRLGCGKSTMAVALLCEAATSLRSVRYASLMRVLSELSDARHDGSLTATIEGIGQPRVLALDGTWHAFANWASMETLRCALDERCSRGRVTILVGDGTKEQFDTAIGAKLVNRINRTGATLVTGWEPFPGFGE